MIPSEVLRTIIANKYNLPLMDYAWDENLKTRIFSIQTDRDFEPRILNLKEAYLNGCNIGHCGLTSRYFSLAYENALMHVGTSLILTGTKHSANGSHAWVEMDGYVLDPTLMILFPCYLKEKFGYTTNYIISKSSSKLLSEYDLFDHELTHSFTNPNYEAELYEINDQIKRG